MHLHIVSFNIPYPPNYGGVIDVYFRIKSLFQAGVKVHLHCYEYGRAHSNELSRLCAEVYYYKRKTSWQALLAGKPYIVASRQSNELVERLKQDDYPILIEGLHCAYILEQLPAERTIIVRAHNVEHDYYKLLSKAETNPLKRFYLSFEAQRLQRYEPVLKRASAVLAVTVNDVGHFEQLGCKKVVLLPSSHAYEKVHTKLGRGYYALYHGDLSVPENIKAVRYLVEKIFSAVSLNLVIAGRNPSREVQKWASSGSNLRLVPNPSDEQMDSLIAEAQACILVTDQNTGLKLKLLHSLYRGRFCIVNSKLVDGTGLESACIVADTAEELRCKLLETFKRPFTDDDLRRREAILSRMYDNNIKAKTVIEELKTAEEQRSNS